MLWFFWHFKPSGILCQLYVLIMVTPIEWYLVPKTMSHIFFFLYPWLLRKDNIQAEHKYGKFLTATLYVVEITTNLRTPSLYLPLSLIDMCQLCYSLQSGAEPGDCFSGIKIIKLWANSVFFSSGVKVVYFFPIGVKV